MTSPATHVEAAVRAGEGAVRRVGRGCRGGPASGCRPSSISLHCWQGDDVGGFEGTGQAIGGGLAVTGNYPGRARTPDELRADLDRTLSLLPGRHRLNLHASYAETGRKQGRARRPRARALPRLDRLGEVAADRDGLQPDVLRPPAGRRRLHPGASRPGHPPVLDRPRHRLPPDRRGHRHGAGLALHHQRLDPRRLQGSAHRPQGPARSGWPSRSTPSSPSRSTRRPTRTPSRASSSASARRATSSARTSSTTAMPSRARSSSASTPATTTRPRSSPTRSRPCSSTSTRSCCTSAGACAGTATTS